jgi:hypothetical protein
VWQNGSTLTTTNTGAGPDQVYVPVSFRYLPPPPTTTNFVTGVTRHVALRNDFSGLVGGAITVGSTPLTISDLGRYVQAGNSSSHRLSLYRASDGNLVASTTINLTTIRADSTGFACAPLASSVSLPAGGVYHLVSSETAGGDSWEGWPSFPTLAHTSVATISGAGHARWVGVRRINARAGGRVGWSSGRGHSAGHDDPPAGARR